MTALLDLRCTKRQRPGAAIVEINDPIGRMRRALRAWLLAGGPS